MNIREHIYTLVCENPIRNQHSVNCQGINVEIGLIDNSLIVVVENCMLTFNVCGINIKTVNMRFASFQGKCHSCLAITRLGRLPVELHRDSRCISEIVFEAGNGRRVAATDIKSEDFFQFEFTKNAGQFLQKIFRNIDLISLFIFVFLKPSRVVKMVENPMEAVEVYVGEWFDLCQRDLGINIDLQYDAIFGESVVTMEKVECKTLVDVVPVKYVAESRDGSMVIRKLNLIM